MNHLIRSCAAVSRKQGTLVGRSCCGPMCRYVVLRPPLVAVVAALFGVILCLSRHSYAGAFDYNDSGWEGTSELLRLARSTLGTSRVQLTANLDYAKLTPRDALIVLHPTVALHSESLSEFMG